MLVFLIIGGIGILGLLVSLILGDLVDGLFDGLGSDLFSGAALTGFAGAFGFVGALVLDQTDSTPAAVVAGIVGGLLVGLGAGWFSARLRREGAEVVRTSSLVGRRATVLTAIPEDGYGQISMLASGHLTRLNARSAWSVEAGAEVTIVATLSATSVQVEPTLR